jgi:hypothetical protein
MLCYAAPWLSMLWLCSAEFRLTESGCIAVMLCAVPHRVKSPLGQMPYHAVLRCAAFCLMLSCCDAVCCGLQGEKPPEPDKRTLREPDVAAGVMELQQLGLVGLLMQQHGVVASR